MDMRKVLAAAEAEDTELCAGCANRFLLSELVPVDEGSWACRVCYRNELEGLSVWL